MNIILEQKKSHIPNEIGSIKYGQGAILGIAFSEENRSQDSDSSGISST
jgi:hypothetical protein